MFSLNDNPFAVLTAIVAPAVSPMLPPCCAWAPEIALRALSIEPAWLQQKYPRFNLGVGSIRCGWATGAVAGTRAVALQSAANPVRVTGCICRCCLDLCDWFSSGVLWPAACISGSGGGRSCYRCFCGYRFGLRLHFDGA
jgi:hypothetical protein